ncbi:MAG: D-glycero-beta-D-manno-heptose-7-phosphate kinase [Candidatus Omnitrophica bacterium]|nr:D-glycero-beta-D-manno-heptose-7-phosphate kinase [Candidatus Omnitrophota bacterium]
MSFSHLKSFIPKFKKIRVLVIGDLILDEFVWGQVTRISPEAPVPVVWVRSRSFMPGGALNVSHNIRALGARPIPCGVIGKDERAVQLKELLKAKGIETGSMVEDPSRPTTLKTRVIAHQQQVVRIDEESNSRVNGGIRRALLDEVRRKIASVDCLIIEDYGKGVVDPELIREVVTLARRRKLIITVDPKEDHFEFYRGAHVVTPNQHEAETMAGFKITDMKTLLKAGRELLKKLDLKAVLITRGEQGMSLFERGGAVRHIPTQAREVYDVSGAGDTVVGVFTLGLACGASFSQAAVIANTAAGIVVGKVGVAVVTPAELTKALDRS